MRTHLSDPTAKLLKAALTALLLAVFLGTALALLPGCVSYSEKKSHTDPITGQQIIDSDIHFP